MMPLHQNDYLVFFFSTKPGFYGPSSEMFFAINTMSSSNDFLKAVLRGTTSKDK